MPIRTRTTHELIARRDEAEDGHDDFAFGGLHLLVAGLYLASGAEAALGERRGEYAAAGTRWGPLAAAPLAAVAHAARALAPCRATRIIAQIVNGVAVAVGTVGLASSVASTFADEDASFFGSRRRTLRDRIPSLAPLAFGVTGVLGAMLDHQEEEEAAALERLRRRARIVERLTPGRRPRLDRVVVHI